MSHLCTWVLYAEAQAAFQEFETVVQERGNQNDLAYATLGVGGVQVHLGQYEEALSALLMTSTLFQELGNNQGLAFALEDLGRVSLGKGADAEALQQWMKSLGIWRRFERQVPMGRCLASLAYANRRLGARTQAQQHLTNALQIATSQKDLAIPLIALPALALQLADLGQPERAVEIYALASRYPHVANSRWFYDVAGGELESLAKTLPAAVAEAAEARGRTRDLRETMKAFLAELKGTSDAIPKTIYP